MERKTLINLPDIDEIAEAVSKSTRNQGVDIALRAGDDIEFLTIYPFAIERDPKTVGRFVVKALHQNETLIITIDPFADIETIGTVESELTQ